jgi:hypothetical protein
MSDDPHPSSPPPPPDDGPRSQQVRHSNIGARVPEHVGRGVFATGVIVLQATHEFVLDFLQRMTRPQQVSARVVLPPPVVAGFIRALEENLGHYERKFGPARSPQLLPSAADSKAPSEVAGGEGSGPGGSGDPFDPTVGGEVIVEPSRPVDEPRAEDVYDELKLPDAMLAGAYANAVMISHTNHEFCFDFLTTFFPRSAVSARVFLAAPNAPAFLGSLKHSFEQYQHRRIGGDPPAPPAG